MKKVTLEQFPQQVQSVVRSSVEETGAGGAPITVCIADTATGEFVELELGNHAQLNQLASGLVGLGFVLQPADPDDSNLVFRTKK
jgi:hypothetical protein